MPVAEMDDDAAKLEQEKDMEMPRRECWRRSSRERDKTSDNERVTEGDATTEAMQSNLIQYGEFRTAELILGMKITASSGMCKDVFATIPMPMEYPEQKVRVTSTDFPATARYFVRPLTDTVQQLVITIPAGSPEFGLGSNGAYRSSERRRYLGQQILSC
jgi:hypothetical protein